MLKMSFYAQHVYNLGKQPKTTMQTDDAGVRDTLICNDTPEQNVVAAKEKINKINELIRN